jgi:creatinine amidohydrolase
MKKVKYHEMLPHEILARRKKFPAAFIGLGTIEWHGEHLAVGNDALKAEKLCELAAAKSGGFAFPTLWYGEPRITALLEADYDGANGDKAKSFMGFKKKKFSDEQYGKSAEQQISFYKELIRHILLQMNALEMKAVCLLCGHYPLYDWALEVVEEFNSKCKDTKAFAGIEFHYPVGKKIGGDQDPTKEIVVGGDHAAKWETSYLYYLRPDCVDMSIFLGREDEPLIGVVGDDPRKESSVEIGRKACELIVAGMVKKAEELVAEYGVQS